MEENAGYSNIDGRSGLRDRTSCVFSHFSQTRVTNKTFSDEEIQAAGGIHAIERVVEEESYWFVRLRQLRGELGEYGLTYHDSAIAALPSPSESDWRTGRRNPAFGKSELERIVFRSVYRAVERMLKGWKWVEGPTANAYALKELRVSAKRLSGLTNALHSIRQVHDVARITVIKHWYDATWSEPYLPTRSEARRARTP